MIFWVKSIFFPFRHLECNISHHIDISELEITSSFKGVVNDHYLSFGISGKHRDNTSVRLLQSEGFLAASFWTFGRDLRVKFHHHDHKSRYVSQVIVEQLGNQYSAALDANIHWEMAQVPHFTIYLFDSINIIIMKRLFKSICYVEYFIMQSELV